MSGPRGSIAAASFADALEFLQAHRPAPSSRRVAFDLPRPAPAAPSARVGDAPAASRAPCADDGPLHEAAAALAAGKVSARELVEEALALVAARDAELGAIVAIDVEDVRAAADRADGERAAGRPCGLLHGIPITVKDVIHVAGLPTRAGSLAYDHLPGVDAAAVARLRAAGAIILAKASTHEFALGVTCPQTSNPHDAGRIPGGSSGGSAVAVATGMGLASLGTDTRASIRVPAALSGVVGFKATYGAVPTGGIVSLSWTMDHVAPMARTVADAAAVMDMLMDPAGPGGLRPALATVAASAVGVRVGVPRAAFAGAEVGVADVVERALRSLAGEGASVREVARPDTEDFALANAAGLVVSRSEAAAAHRSLDLDRSLYWEEVADQLAMAEALSAMDYLDAQRLRGQATEEMLEVFTHVDVLAMPTVPVVAPRRDDFARYLMLLARNAILWSFTGFPAMSVPCGTVDGLPVGIQLVAPPGSEALLVAVGRVVEATRPC